jgi:hypothetical protein
MATPTCNVNDSWLSDLVKIGIPVLGTIASLVFGYLMKLSSDKKDLTLEDFRRDAEQTKVAVEKRSTLVLQIAEKITIIEKALADHSGVFRRERPDEIDCPSVEMTERARIAFNNVHAAVDACVGANVLVDLLSEPKLSAQYQIFLESLFTFQREANPDRNMDRFDLMDWLARVKRSKEPVLKMLSAIHLGIALPSVEDSR